jgi:hypothetical protein
MSSWNSSESTGPGGNNIRPGSEYTEHINSNGSVHHTWYNTVTNDRMSWDTRDSGDGYQDYLYNTGHETDQDTNQHFSWDR